MTGMIPFIAIDEAKIAPFHPYGVCCAIAFFAWDYAIMKMAARRGFERADFRVLTVLMGVFGWTFAWGVDAVFYHPGESLGSRFTVQGLSSTGAIVGATIGGILWSRVWIRKDERGWRVSRREKSFALIPISEVILATWPIAFAFGRLGCSLIHDHVGRAVTPGSTLGSLLGIGFPHAAEDGVHTVYGPIHVVTGAPDVRYDLGVIELLVLAIMAVGFAFTFKKAVPMGVYTILSCLVYGPFRFALDFLRPEEGDGPTGEARRGGLTFAQYWSLAIIALGVALIVRRYRGGPFVALPITEQSKPKPDDAPPATRNEEHAH